MDEARPLDIEIGATGDIRVVRLGGELDLASVPRLTELLEEVAAPRLILDLSGLAFIDSSGVAALVRAQHQMDEGGQTLTLTRPSHAVARVFEILGISFLLDTDNSD
jgi:anti-sigma B factor antagonist